MEWNTTALTDDITLLSLVDVTTAIVMRSACILSKIFLQAWNLYQPHFLEGAAIDLIDKKMSISAAHLNIPAIHKEVLEDLECQVHA